jgi:hypothetical protein
MLICSSEHLTEMPDNINVYSRRYKEVIKFAEVENSYLTECHNIIGHLPLNNTPLLEGVMLLPKIVVEDDVEKLALEIHPILMEDDWDKNKQYRDEWIAGYKAATKVYSQRDLDKAIDWALEMGRKGKVTSKDIDEFIQSLKHPKSPKYFYAETEEVSYADDACASDGGYYTRRYSVTELKIITDVDYNDVLVGYYEF